MNPFCTPLSPPTRNSGRAVPELPSILELPALPSDIGIRTSSPETARRMLIAARDSSCDWRAITNAALNYKHVGNSILDDGRELLTYLIPKEHIEEGRTHGSQDQYKKTTSDQFHNAISKSAGDHMEYEIYFILAAGKAKAGKATIYLNDGKLWYFEKVNTLRSEATILFDDCRSLTDFNSGPKEQGYTAEHLTMHY